jgi:DNA-binding XRE family transcriptional regulator
MGATLNDREMVIKEASLWEYALAILVDRIGQLPKESKDDLIELMVLLRKSTSKEEQAEIKQAMTEILLPSVVGDLVKGPMPKSGSAELDKRTEHLGMKIKEFRAKKSMTQEDLAELSGLPQSHISRLESGKHSPSHLTLEKIAKALGVSIHDIDYEEHE